MNFEPQTYEELIRMKRCVELTKYYEVTEEELWEIYHLQAPAAAVVPLPTIITITTITITDRTRKQWHSYPKHFKSARWPDHIRISEGYLLPQPQ